MRKHLPIKDLPNPLKRELEALAMLQGNYTIIGESKELVKCEGDLSREELVMVNRSFQKGKKKMATMGDVGQRIRVTVVKTETDSGAEKLKCFVVERSGEVEEDKVEEAIYLTNKVIQDCKVLKGARFQTFVNNGSLNAECHVPTRAGEAEKFVKTSMFINQKGKLVMLNTVQKKGLVISSKTIAQRD